MAALAHQSAARLDRPDSKEGRAASRLEATGASRRMRENLKILHYYLPRRIGRRIFMSLNSIWFATVAALVLLLLAKGGPETVLVYVIRH
jgi:hypothetical protein